jgi:hypothetical protein
MKSIGKPHLRFFSSMLEDFVSESTPNKTKNSLKQKLKKYPRFKEECNQEMFLRKNLKLILEPHSQSDNLSQLLEIATKPQSITA